MCAAPKGVYNSIAPQLLIRIAGEAGSESFNERAHGESLGGESMSVFVLLHGGGQGGWVWRSTARLRRQGGHDKFTPTLSGFGERNNLNGPQVSFQTFIDDVANTIIFDDLRDVVLVGHSMGGVLIPRVAEMVADRIRRVV